MLAVLITMLSSLKQTRSTQKTVPSLIAWMVFAPESQPMSLAKWLKVPPGNTASGSPASTATPAAHDTDPSPPAMASTSARWAAERNASSIVVGTDLDDLDRRQLRSHLVGDRRAGTAARGRVDHQDDAGTVGSSRRVDLQRVGGGQMSG